MCPVWLLVSVAVVGVAKGGVSQCWEHASCQELNSESRMMECIELCHSDINAETPVFPGNAHLQPVPPSDSHSPPPFSVSTSSSFRHPFSSSNSSPQTKRSYSMEHFRWGKPVGRKRRPVKVYTSNGVEEESADVFPEELIRRELTNEVLAREEEEEKAQQVVQEEENQLLSGIQEKKDDLYKMKQFRWSGPPASKRYGGFMKSWDERVQTPLLTLFKNIINKDGQQQ
ncbi:pro-opiomelanocortin-like [Thalassophryne amazonica]|uniref:pro-opiomelanocortin-like n=1 Tax=Thalassophryne amazonica TaxID=390379 RepID=UPI00147179AD|nr:pro-opiomelanocortin-like [Thalassophryne amazonica]